jgi:aryl-alcohol dehydrogenase-like predicted oxidoreductase
MSLTAFRTLGHSGLIVSPLALGTMTFGTQRWGSPDNVSESIFNAYVEAGGNFIDTADVYANGRSEELIGGYVTDEFFAILRWRGFANDWYSPLNAAFTTVNLATRILVATVGRTSTVRWRDRCVVSIPTM